MRFRGIAKAADIVVNEIRANGGKAVANYDSVENGDRIIATAIDHFGAVHILINNAGILRDVSFKNMTDRDWDLIMTVHVDGAYKVYMNGTVQLFPKSRLFTQLIMIMLL